jgi:sugar (pentulose or hexulose) kinase
MTQKDSVVLALDSGSQSSRALLFDAQGAVLAKGSQSHAPMRHPSPGAVEQDPHDIRDALFASIRGCLEEWGGDPQQICGASLTTQRNTILPVAEDGRPLSDAVSWLDRRTASADGEPSRLLRNGLKLLGDQAMIPRLLSKSIPRVWREFQPSLIQELRWVAPLEAWLHHQLTGTMAMAPGGMAGVLPSDLGRRGWAKSGLMYKLLGFERSSLPDIIEAGEEIGRIHGEAAAATGLPEGLRLFACGGDKQAEALGAGVRLANRGVAAISMGTASSIMLPWGKAKQSSKYHWLTLCSAERASWQLEYMVFRGMWTVGWFARNFGADLKSRAQEEGRPVEALLCDEAADVPAGSDGVVVWPRWSPTLQMPSEAGSIMGLRETHGRGHLFRALLEGIAFDLRRGRGILEQATGSRIREVRVGGGGARSELVVQILADVLNLPVVRPQSEELSARGAALVAAVGAQLHPSLDAAVSALVPEAPRYVPDPSRVKTYDALYRRVFLRGGRELDALNQELATLVR